MSKEPSKFSKPQFNYWTVLLVSVALICIYNTQDNFLLMLAIYVVGLWLSYKAADDYKKNDL